MPPSALFSDSLLVAVARFALRQTWRSKAVAFDSNRTRNQSWVLK